MASPGAVGRHAYGWDFREVDPGVDDETVRDLVTHHEQLGHLVRPDGRLSGTSSIRLNDAGLAEVRDRQRRRRDPKLRAVASRDAVLDWLYGQGAAVVSVTAIRGTPWSHFEGDPFTASELQRAAAYLEARGLINGIRSGNGDDIARPLITDDGRDCVEQYGSSTVDWMRGGDSIAGGTQINTHFHGNVSGQVGIAGRDQSQTRNHGIDADTLLSLLSDVRGAANSIDETSRASVLAYADTIQAEAESDEADPELTRGILRRLKQLAEKIGDTALNTAVGALSAGGLKALGLE